MRVPSADIGRVGWREPGGSVMVSEWSWMNEAAEWGEDGGGLWMRTQAGTDFWRVTHYGFVRHTGHLAYREVSGDFRVDVVARGEYEARYDQAGLMVWIDEETWIKCGIEFVDGAQQASAVVTRGFSDWSVAALTRSPERIWLRVTREGTAVLVHFSLDGETYSLLRMGYLPGATTVRVGPMAASPDGPGFVARFDGFVVTEQ